MILATHKNAQGVFDMREQDMGIFIRAKRMERHLTQKQLAEQLGVTDKAVSKWETGNSLPDISLLLPLAAALGVSPSELLGGAEQSEEPPVDMVVETVAYSQRADRRNRLRKLRVWLFSGISGAFLIAALVCWISDMAINDALTWSVTVYLSLILAWVLLVPLLLSKKPIRLSLTALSVVILPYLYGLSRTCQEPLIFRAGLPIAAVSVVYLWICYGLCRKLWNRKWLAASGVLLLSLPLTFLINVIVFIFFGEVAGQNQFTAPLLLSVACLLIDLTLHYFCEREN